MACSEEWASCVERIAELEPVDCRRSYHPRVLGLRGRICAAEGFAGRFRTFMVFVREGPGYARWVRVRQR
jgi:hypothetical protein